jgi:alkanesulfonate monooxygenase SsuD/methylene tetrahydromethanopterin reductase-like flavin-dependent oxidoreductase (luciferase family)
MDVDIVLDSHLPSKELTDLGLLAERYGIRCVWNASYLDGRDPFTNMAQLARESSSICVAPMALNGYEMHPFRITMALLTLNELAPGRVMTMIGGGGEVVMGLKIPFDKRVRYVREVLEFIKGATTERPFSYDGELFKIENYNPQWPTAEPPFLYAGANKPQMLKMASTTADGIFMSDLSVNLSTHVINDALTYRQDAGLDCSEFRFNNFMAWYVYDDPAEARFEARRWIGFRALFRDYMMKEFVADDEFQVLLDHMPEIYAMAPNNTDSVEGVPDELLDRCVDKLTLTGGTADLDRIIEHLLEFKASGVTEICLELKNHQAHGIKLLGERVIPALR